MAGSTTAPVAAATAKTAEQLETERETRRAQTIMASTIASQQAAQSTAKTSPTPSPTTAPTSAQPTSAPAVQPTSAPSTAPTSAPSPTVQPAAAAPTAPVAQPTSALVPAAPVSSTPRAVPSPSPNAQPIPPAPPTVPTSAQVDDRRQAIESAAANYRPTLPPVTVNTPITRKVAAPVVKAKTDADTALTKVNADNAAIAATNTQLSRVYDTGDPRKAVPLEKRLAAQKAQLAKDNGDLAKAKATIAAGNTVVYSEQRTADTATANKSKTASNTAQTALQKALPKGMKLTNGQLSAEQLATLTPAQLTLYNNYITSVGTARQDADKVNADTAAINQNYTELQTYMPTTTSVTVNRGDTLTGIAGTNGTPVSTLYGTNPQFDPRRQDGRLTTGNGVNGRDPDLIHPGENVNVSAGGAGVAVINQALGRGNPQLRAPKIVSPTQARKNLTAAQQDANYYAAVWNQSSAAVGTLNGGFQVTDAQTRVISLQQQVTAQEKTTGVCVADSPLIRQLDAAKADLAKAQQSYNSSPAVLDYNVSATYVAKLSTQQGTTIANQTLADTQAQYNTWQAANRNLPASDNPYSTKLTKARRDAQVAMQKSDVANSAFVAAIANRYAAQQATPAQTLTDQQLAKAQYYWEQSGKPQSGSPAQSIINARTANEAAHVLNLEADRKLMDWRQTVAENNVTDAQTALTWAQFNGDQTAIVAANTQLKQANAALNATRIDAKNAQFAEGQYKYFLTLPANLQDPKTAQDAAQLETKLDEYRRGQLRLNASTDFATAQQVVSGDLSAETNKLNSRGFMQTSADGYVELFGGTRSQLETYLQNKQGALATLDAQRGQISETEFQTRLNSIMSGYNDTYTSMSKGEAATDGNWKTADEWIRGGTAVVVGIAVTAVTFDPLLGGAAAFGTYQAWDGANDMTASLMGGDIGADGHVSLMGLGAEAATTAITGQSWDKVGRDAQIAGMDVITDGISAATVGLGAGAGSIVGKATSNFVAENVGNFLAKETVSQTVGAVAPRLATSAGREAAAQFGGRVVGNAAGYSTGQAIMGTGNVANTAIQLGAQGQLFTADGANTLLHEAGNQAIYTVGGMFLGGTAGAVTSSGLRGVAAQSAVNIGGMTAQEEVRSRIMDGRDASTSQLLMAAGSGIPGTALGYATRPSFGTSDNVAYAAHFGADGTPSLGLMRPNGRTTADVNSPWANGTPQRVTVYESSTAAGGRVNQDAVHYLTLNADGSGYVGRRLDANGNITAYTTGSDGSHPLSGIQLYNNRPAERPALSAQAEQRPAQSGPAGTTTAPTADTSALVPIYPAAEPQVPPAEATGQNTPQSASVPQASASQSTAAAQGKLRFVNGEGGIFDANRLGTTPDASASSIMLRGYSPSELTNASTLAAAHRVLESGGALDVEITDAAQMSDPNDVLALQGAWRSNLEQLGFENVNFHLQNNGSMTATATKAMPANSAGATGNQNTNAGQPVSSPASAATENTPHVADSGLGDVNLQQSLDAPSDVAATTTGNTRDVGTQVGPQPAWDNLVSGANQGAPEPVPAESGASRQQGRHTVTKQRRVTLEQSVSDLKQGDNQALTSAARSLSRGGKLTIKTTDDISSREDRAAIQMRLEAEGLSRVRFVPGQDNTGVNTITAEKPRRAPQQAPAENASLPPAEPVMLTPNQPKPTRWYQGRRVSTDWRVGVTGRAKSRLPGVESGPTDSSVGRGLGTKTGLKKPHKSNRFSERRNPTDSHVTGYSAQEALQFKGDVFQDAVTNALTGKADQSPFEVRVIGFKDDGMSSTLTLGFDLKTNPAELKENEGEYFGAKTRDVREVPQGIPFNKVMDESKAGIPGLGKKALVAAAIATHNPFLIGAAAAAALRPSVEVRPEQEMGPIPAGAKIAEPTLQEVEATVRRVRIKLNVTSDNPAALQEAVKEQPKLEDVSGLLNKYSEPYIPRGVESGFRLSNVSGAPDHVNISGPTGKNITGMNPKVTALDVSFNKKNTLDYLADRFVTAPIKRGVYSRLPNKVKQSKFGRRMTPQTRYMLGRSPAKEIGRATGRWSTRVKFSLAPLNLKGSLPEWAGSLGASASGEGGVAVKTDGNKDAVAPMLGSKRAQKIVPFSFTDAQGNEMTAGIPNWLRTSIRRDQRNEGVAWPKGGTEQVQQMLDIMRQDAANDPAALSAIDDFASNELSTWKEGTWMKLGGLKKFETLLGTVY